MKPGEYIGKDGRTYRWVLTGDTKLAEGDGCYALMGGNYGKIAPADWPAAKAALDALIEAEAGEWVEWEAGNARVPYRCRRDGTDTQYLGCDGWNPVSGEAPVPRAYRAGLKVGREEARELAARVASADTDSKYEEGGRRLLYEQEWKVIVPLAKKVLG